MNLHDAKYAHYGLVADMLATSEIIAKYDPAPAGVVAKAVREAGRVLLTGEGSSRIFPAKHAIMASRRRGDPLALQTEAALQARDYDLRDWVVLGASNSGRTAEVIQLFSQLAEREHPHLYGLTAFADTPLANVTRECFVLGCGPESAVAATKSVVEQALFTQMVLEQAGTFESGPESLSRLGAAFAQVLQAEIDPAIVDRLASAQTIYFAGRNDGVAEELTLKTNEIARKRSDYLEGTYAVHGIEEIMNPGDVVVWVDPFPSSEAKFADVLAKGVGLEVIAIADRETPFPTVRVPSHPDSSYLMLAAGWSLLTELGIALGVDLDKPVRARKVGYEVASS